MTREDIRAMAVGSLYTVAAIGTAWAFIMFLRHALPVCTALERAMGSSL